MPTMRSRVLPVSSLALVAVAALAVLTDAAKAQEPVRVRYGTDPGYSGGPQVLSFRSEDAPTPGGEITHTVEAGETVYALARLYDVPPAAIISKNGLQAPYGLKIGQAVTIPMGPEPMPALPEAVGMDRQPMQRVQSPAARPAQQFDLDRVYEVRPGDTLYSLSRAFGMPVTDLAAANSLRQPYTLSVGQRLVVPGAAREQQPVRSAAPAPVASPAVASRSMTPDSRALDRKVIEETFQGRRPPEAEASSRFAWPVRGTVLVDFGSENGGEVSQGINIAAPIGAPVRATADGEVVYRGSELDGYGNLLLVRHDGGWVSAYAHTDAILVRKGDFVRQGQVIAKVGRSGSVPRPQLHFQLRKDLQPQDPIIAMQGDFDGQELTAASLQ